MLYLAGQVGDFHKLSYWVGEMFEGDFAETCATGFLLTPMGDEQRHQRKFLEHFQFFSQTPPTQLSSAYYFLSKQFWSCCVGSLFNVFVYVAVLRFIDRQSQARLSFPCQLADSRLIQLQLSPFGSTLFVGYY